MDPYEMDIWERPFNLSETIVDELYQILDLQAMIQSPECFYAKQLKLLQFLENRVDLKVSDYLVVLDYVRQMERIPVGFYLTTRNSSYILLALIILYIKTYDDTYYYNSIYVKWFKIDLKTLNKTEYAIFKHLRLFRKISDGIL